MRRGRSPSVYFRTRFDRVVLKKSQKFQKLSRNQNFDFSECKNASCQKNLGVVPYSNELASSFCFRLNPKSEIWEGMFR